MRKAGEKPGRFAALSDDDILSRTVGELTPLAQRVVIVDYDPHWPDLFQREAEKIQAALGPRAMQIEHIGSTAVPGLAAKPVIDILLVVADSACEEQYAAALESIGYTLRIREPDWHEHRMFVAAQQPDRNLHVFSAGSAEIARLLLFRDWLRSNRADRELYQRTKLELAQKDWKYVQNYADAKTAVVEEILGRASLHRE